MSIPRFFDKDPNGILSLGKAGDMERRRKQFVDGWKKQRAHSEGILLSILEKYAVHRIDAKYPNSDFFYSYLGLETEQRAIQEERWLIKKYVMHFGEVPPLNSAIPKRYDYPDWAALKAALGITGL